jgi:hypothetical protein
VKFQECEYLALKLQVPVSLCSVIIMGRRRPIVTNYTSTVRTSVGVATALWAVRRSVVAATALWALRISVVAATALWAVRTA